MINHTLADIQKSQLFQPTTQGEKYAEDLLIDNCNRLQGRMQGFVETRRELLNSHFDKELLVTIIEETAKWNEFKGNKLWLCGLQSMIEAVSRDMIYPYMVEDFVRVIEMKLKHFGSVEALSDHIEKYFTSGKIVPMAQTWKEACEEVEKGLVIYYEPNASRAV